VPEQPSAALDPESSMPDPASLPRPWLASYPPGVPPTYVRPEVPVTRLLDDAARDFPDSAAAVRGRIQLSYAELLDRVDRFAAALRTLGVEQGTRVLVALDNRPAAVVSLFAVWRLGGVVVQLGTETGVLGRAAEETEAALLVCDVDDVPEVNGLRPGLPRLDHVIVDDTADWYRGPRALLARARARRAGRYRPSSSDEVERLADLVEQAEPGTGQVRLPADEPALIQYGVRGGGAAILTHANLVAAAFQARLWVPDTQAGRERVLALLPFATSSGVAIGLLAPVLSAATVVLARSEPEVVLAAIEEREVTLLVAYAHDVAKVVSHPDVAETDLSRLRVGLVFGGTLEPEAAADFEERSGVRLRDVHGTARAPITHANPIYGRSSRGQLGLPVTDTAAIVVDPRDPRRVLPAGEAGELAVHGPQVGRRLLGEPDRVSRAGGWLVSGDRVVMRPSGIFERVGPQGPVLDHQDGGTAR
jgi:long-chain acyl-CoA synthetase